MRLDRSRAKSRASDGLPSATLMASTDSCASGSAASDVISIRSGRCRRTSWVTAPSRIGSGTGSYSPAIRNRRGRAPRDRRTATRRRRSTAPATREAAAKQAWSGISSGVAGLTANHRRRGGDQHDSDERQPGQHHSIISTVTPAPTRTLPFSPRRTSLSGGRADLHVRQTLTESGRRVLLDPVVRFGTSPAGSPDGMLGCTHEQRRRPG